MKLSREQMYSLIVSTRNEANACSDSELKALSADIDFNMDNAEFEPLNYYLVPEQEIYELLLHSVNCFSSLNEDDDIASDVKKTRHEMHENMIWQISEDAELVESVLSHVYDNCKPNMAEYMRAGINLHNNLQSMLERICKLAGSLSTKCNDTDYHLEYIDGQFVLSIYEPDDNHSYIRTNCSNFVSDYPEAMSMLITNW